MSFRPSEGRIQAEFSRLRMGGITFSTTIMNLKGDFKPRLTDPALLFTTEDRPSIEGLKVGLRRLLSKYHPPSVALCMVQALNFNYLRSRGREACVIMATSDGSQMAESILVDLYARALQNQSVVETPRANYYVVLEGVVDHQRVNFLTQHYFWLNSAFTAPEDQRGHRFFMN